MLDLQIKMLTEQYGWDKDRVAKFLDVSPSVVSISLQSQNLPVHLGQVTIDELKGVELVKQSLLAPMQAIVESQLLEKIRLLIADAESSLDIKNLVAAFKDLTEHSVTHTLANVDKNAKPNIAIQVLNEIH